MSARQTVERRQLGLMLRRYRTLQGRSQYDVGLVIGQGDSRISKVEDGAATLSPEQLEKVLEFLGVPQPDRLTILELGARARKRRRRTAKESHAYTDTLPDSFQRIADMEADAVAIYCFEPGVIPGLLQSPGYARAITRSCDGIFWAASESEIETRVAFRRDRQSKIFGAAPAKRLEFVFTEDVLGRGAENTGVMSEQLQHLLQLSGEFPNVGMRVISPGNLENPVSNGGVTVLDFDGSAPRVAFTPTIYGPSTYFDNENDTTALFRAFRRVQELAVDHSGTLDIIKEKLREV